MKTHTTIGGDPRRSRAPVFVLAREIVLTHHERWDGVGYPAGTKGESIPMSGRIVCAADIYDALTYIRPYKKALAPAQALAEIDADSGRHFDPAVVKALKRLLAARALSPDA